MTDVSLCVCVCVCVCLCIYACFCASLGLLSESVSGGGLPLRQSCAWTGVVCVAVLT